MAINAKNIAPIDRKPRYALGVKLPFSKSTAFSPTYVTKDAIKYNLINYFLTDGGERYMNPNFGGGLSKYLFEQITTGDFENIKEDISNKITLYFPTVVVSNIIILETHTENSFIITIEYHIPSLNIIDDLTFTL